MDELIRQHDSHLTRLTLNRPQKANALSASLVEALLDAVDYAHGDGTRFLVLGINFITEIGEPARWGDIVQRAQAHCDQLTPAAAAALHRQTTPDTRADDMAALARSVSVPGLIKRIRLYRDNNT